MLIRLQVIGHAHHRHAQTAAVTVAGIDVEEIRLVRERFWLHPHHPKVLEAVAQAEAGITEHPLVFRDPKESRRLAEAETRSG